MIIPLERRGAKPVFRQIVDYVRRNIESGRLSPGTQLQPIRLLARELGVNRETVADAYRELETLGLSESGVGRGTFVLARPGGAATAADARSTTVAPVVRSFVPVLSRAAGSTAALPVIDYSADARAVRFEALVPSPSLYPLDDFRKAVNHVLARQGRALLGYGDLKGHEGLRRVLVERLTASGIETEAEEIVLTAGSTQALSLVARALCDPGDAVVIEEPTYAGAYATFASLGLRVLPVSVTDGGLDLAALGQHLRRGGARFVYTMPSFQNPTGITTSLEHRRQLLDLAARHGVPVVEDDYEKDMRVSGRPVPPLKALDRSGHVIYVGTFSKTLFPGVRSGWIVGPRRLIDAVAALKRASDLASSAVLQAALAVFCRAGHYDRHMRRVVRELTLRLARAAEALDEHLPEGSGYRRPEGGFTIWVTLPEAIDTLALLPAARRAGVTYAPGCIFYPDGRRSTSLRLSLGYARLDDIERGIRALGSVARAALPSRRGRRAMPAEQSIHV